MLKKLLIFCFTGALSVFAWANALYLSDDAPEVYTVKRGDTLWDIAGLYLDKPWNWPALWHKNPNIDNPHLIYPGDILRLSYEDGKPILTRTKGSSEERAWPINGVPESVLRQYLTYDTLIEDIDVNRAPRVLGSQEGWSYLSMRAPFYVDLPVTSQAWFIYRVGEKFERKFEGKTIKMRSLKQVGEAEVVAVLDDMSEMKLIKQTQEIKPNDILLPALRNKTGDIIYPRAAPLGLIGNMVGHLYGSKYVGLRQIVVIDLGLEDGLVAGDTLSAQLPGSSLKGGRGKMRYITGIDNEIEPVFTQLPARSAGTLLVIHSYPYFSLAMVANAEQPLSAPMTVISVGS